MNFLNFYELSLYNTLCFTFCCMNNPLLNVFQEIYTLKVKSKYSLRTNNYLKEPFCPTKFNQYCIVYQALYL